eukprot:scaffold36275_cov154-Isochrysis_galbana.AAC.18
MPMRRVSVVVPADADHARRHLARATRLPFCGDQPGRRFLLAGWGGRREVSRELPCGRVVKDEGRRQRLARLGLELVAELDRPEGVETRLHERRVGIDLATSRLANGLDDEVHAHRLLLPRLSHCTAGRLTVLGKVGEQPWHLGHANEEFGPFEHVHRNNRRATWGKRGVEGNHTVRQVDESDAHGLQPRIDSSACRHAHVGPRAPLHRGCGLSALTAAGAKGVERVVCRRVVSLAAATNESRDRREEAHGVERRHGARLLQRKRAECLGRIDALNGLVGLAAQETVGKYTGRVPHAGHACRASGEHAAHHPAHLGELGAVTADDAHVAAGELPELRGGVISDPAAARGKHYRLGAHLAQPLGVEQTKAARATRD